MKLALRTHQLRWILPLELALAIVGTLLGFVFVHVPSMSGMGAVPVTVIAALAGTVVLSLPLNAAWPLTRTTPVRSSSFVTISVLVIFLAPVAVVCLLLGLLQPSTAYMYLGTLGWLLAMQILLGTLVSGKYQAMGPVTYVLLCALLGRDDSSIQPWAWPLADLPAATALAIGSGTLIVALAVFAGLGLHRSHS